MLDGVIAKMTTNSGIEERQKKRITMWRKKLTREEKATKRESYHRPESRICRKNPTTTPGQLLTL